MASRNVVLLAVLLEASAAACSGAMGGGSYEENKEPTTEPTGEDPVPGEETGTEPPTGDPDSGTPPPATDTGTSTTPPTDTGSSTPPTDTGPSTPPAGDPPVSGLSLIPNLGISEVAVFQGVKVPLAKSGVKSARNADVIAGREALVRVYVTPQAGWTTREVVGELTLVSAAGGTKTFTTTASPAAASSDATLTSTINFNVPTGVFAVDSKYSVALYAKSGATAGDTSNARYPKSGTESVDAKGTGETLKIKIVPVQYNADGSGRVPDTTASQLERYRQAFYAMYPAKNVEVTVRAPYPWSSAISANGSGFSTLLTSMVKLRQTDGAAKDVYYYGAFTSTSSFSAYCGGGCVTGLCGLLTSAGDSSSRACVGVGFTGNDSPQTAAHEIGHAHGRSHAPCGTSGDGAYPYAGGSIGSWGYDLVARKLFSPSTYKDFMGYCSPTWISDYTYRALTTRMAYVAGTPFLSIPKDAPKNYRFLEVGMDGKLSWGDSITLDEPPLSDPHTVSYLGADGSTVETTTGFYYPYDDLPGGYMLVPEIPLSAKGIAIAGMKPGIESRLIRTP